MSSFQEKKNTEEISFCHICSLYSLYIAAIIFFIKLPRYFCIRESTSSHNKHFVGIPSETVSINKQVSSRRVWKHSLKYAAQQVWRVIGHESSQMHSSIFLFVIVNNLQAQYITNNSDNLNYRRQFYFIQQSNCPSMRFYKFLQTWQCSIFPLSQICFSEK